MDPRLVLDQDDYIKKDPDLIEKLRAYRTESTGYREQVLEPKWSKSLRLLKGIPIEEESSRSKVRGKHKIYFRKVWSSAIRLLASFHQAFLQDKNRFKIHGRDDGADATRAKVLEVMTRYRLEWLMRRRNAYVKLLWALMGCISPGFAVIKQVWKFNKELEIDEPDFSVYPLEQVCLDWPNLTYGNIHDMRFVMFDNYFTRETMEENGYENIHKVTETTVPQSELQQARFSDSQDPYGSHQPQSSISDYSNGSVGNNYPKSGATVEGRNPYLSKYLCTEVFWKKDAKIYYCVFNPETGVYLVEPMPSPYGREYPIALGSMLIDPHKPVPEGITEVVEGPQEALNQTINMRFDNVALSMHGGFIYSRFAGIDKQSLRNIGPGFTVAANDVNGIQPLKVPDVTQSAYAESSQFMQMIEEETGVNPTKNGTSDVTKATVANINLTEANAKHDLFMSIVGQTLFQQFMYNLARHIQMFETDERVYRVANEELRKEGLTPDKYDNVYDIEFDFDLEVDVGLTEVSRAARSQRMAAMLDRMLQSNNSVFLMMKSGVQIPDPKIWNIPEMTAELMPELGFPNIKKFLVPVMPPPPPQAEGQQPPSGGPVGQVVEGQNAPQPNEAAEVNPDFLATLTAQLGQ